MSDDMMLRLAVVAIAGVGAGFINTLAGGGSLLSLSALMLAGLPPDVANGTNRLSIVAQSATGAWGFHRKGKLDTPALGSVVLPTLIGALLGAVIASRFPRTYLKPVMLATMLIMAVVLLLKPKALAPEGATPKAVWKTPAGAAGLFFAGVYGGFIQAGVGFVLLSVLGGLLHYDLTRANALKLVCALIFSVPVLAVFAWHDQVAWVPAVVLAAGAALGSQLAVRFAIKASPAALRAVVLVAVCAALIGAALKD